MTSSHRISNLVKAFGMPDISIGYMNNPLTSSIQRG